MNRIPKLEKVVFWHQDWKGSMPQWTDAEVQEVKQAFRREAVEFVFKLHFEWEDVEPLNTYEY